MNNSKKLSDVRGKLDNVKRKTDYEVASDMLKADIEDAKANNKPELTLEEKAKLFNDHWKALNGFDLDSRD